MSPIESGEECGGKFHQPVPCSALVPGTIAAVGIARASTRGYGAAVQPSGVQLAEAQTMIRRTIPGSRNAGQTLGKGRDAGRVPSRMPPTPQAMAIAGILVGG